MQQAGITVTGTTQYVIRYKLNGERRFDFAHLQSDSLEQAMAALKKIHGESGDEITDVKVSKAL